MHGRHRHGALQPAVELTVDLGWAKATAGPPGPVAIFQAMDGHPARSPSVVLEATHVLVRAVVRSSRLTLALIEDLPNLDGTSAQLQWG